VRIVNNKRDLSKIPMKLNSTNSLHTGLTYAFAREISEISVTILVLADVEMSKS